jgi:hypothetical protein
MLRFELPMVAGRISPNDALTEIIDTAKSGVTFQSNVGDLRLVHYDRIVEAISRGVTQLDDVEFESVVKFDLSLAELNYGGVVSTAGKKFGFVRALSGMADLFSVSESFAVAYNTASSGVRCERPNKPLNMKPRDWYHYYPPNPRNPSNPNVCRVCGFNVP